MNETTISAREPYEEPTVEDLPLQSDEMMVGNCKGDGLGAGSNGGTSCTNPVTGVACKAS
jgi:hypothetical protein